MIQTEITIQKIAGGIWELSGPPAGFFFYLILGENSAALIDSGIGIGSVMEKIRTVTELPVKLILTHGHPDHAGGAAEFNEVYICPLELDVYDSMATRSFREKDVAHMPGGDNFLKVLQPTGPRPEFVSDGEVIDLGGRALKIIYTPGHTHGSISIYDRKTKSMFTGDNVQGRETALREWNSSGLEEYVNSLTKLKQYDIEMIYGGHRPNRNEPFQIDKLISCAQDILGGAQGEERPSRGGGTSLVYEKDGVLISYTKDKISN